MGALSILLLIASGQAVQPPDMTERLPADTRLIVVFDFKKIAASAVAKQHGGRLRAVLGDIPAALANLGIDPDRAERAWVALGSNFPEGTAALIAGKIDPAKVEAKMKQWIRERRFAVRPFREGNRAVYAMELPIDLNPIPGFPSTIYLTASADEMILASDHATLSALLRKPTEPSPVKALMRPYQEVLQKDAAATGVFVPPEALTAAGSLLAGVTAIKLDLTMAESITCRFAFRCSDNAAFQTRLNSELNQSRQLFAPLAKQQGLDDRLISGINELLSRTKAESVGDEVALTTQVDAETLAKILKK